LAGDEHVVGELINNGPGVASDVEVDLAVYDSANHLLDSGSTYASVMDMNPGERSPFEAVFPRQAEYDHAYITGITVSPYPNRPNHFFTTTVTNTYRDPAGYTHIVGTVRNNNMTTAKFVELDFTFYNAAGTTVATDFTYAKTVDLTAGQTSSFEEILLTDDPKFPPYTKSAILTQSSSPPNPTPTFTLRPGGATDIGVGANGSVWVIGTNPTGGGYGVYRWTGAGWAAMPGGAVRIAVDPRGNPWVVNSVHQIYRWTGSAWARYPGAAVDVGVGANGAVWVIGTNPTAGGYAIYRWNGAGWAATPGGAVAIAVDPSGNPWVINSAHQIYDWNGRGWVRCAGGATDIGVGANGSVWITGATPTAGGYGIYRWNGAGWTPVSGGGARIAAGPNGNPWIVNSAHRIYSS
jgi:hypothetical protein